MEQLAESAEQLARSWGTTAGEAFRTAAHYFRSLPANAWVEPTGCEDWNERVLCGHILGEAVWFPRLLRGVTDGAEPYPMELYGEMNEWPAEQQIARLDQATDDLAAVLAAAIPEHLNAPIDVGWSTVPLWLSTYIILMESVYHEWDTRAAREPHSTIPTRWASELAKGVSFSAPLVAHHTTIQDAEGTYRFDVAEGAGPLSVVAHAGKLTVQHGAVGTPDLTLYVTADQLVRLVAGRLRLIEDEASGTLRVEGDRDRIVGLCRMFGGIANG